MTRPKQIAISGAVVAAVVSFIGWGAQQWVLSVNAQDRRIGALEMKHAIVETFQHDVIRRLERIENKLDKL